MGDEKKVPKTLDWVKARAECSIDGLFMTLRGVAEFDAKAADARSGESLEFKLKERSPDTFIVSRHVISGLVEISVIGFTKTRTGIDVFYEDKNGLQPKFSITPLVDVDGECKFQIGADGKALEAWQVTKRALESFLFEHGLSPKPN